MTRGGIASPSAIRLRRRRDFRHVSRVFYCIGAQKAGTTWLYDQLKRHPEIHLGRPKEVHYWDSIYFPHLPYYREAAKKRLSELKAASWRQQVRDHGVRGALRSVHRARHYHDMLYIPDEAHRRYQAFVLRGSSGEPVVGDISPGYAMMRRDGFAAMDKVSPDARFVFILRDPVDRLWSNVRHNRSRGFFEGEDIELDTLFSRAIESPDSGPFQRSDYARTVEELEAVIPSERIAYFFYETLFSPGEMARLSEFLGIAPSEMNFDLRVNAGSEEGARPGGELVELALERLGHVYAMAEERFGEALPESWRLDARARMKAVDA